MVDQEAESEAMCSRPRSVSKRNQMVYVWDALALAALYLPSQIPTLRHSSRRMKRLRAVGS